MPGGRNPLDTIPFIDFINRDDATLRPVSIPIPLDRPHDLPRGHDPTRLRPRRRRQLPGALPVPLALSARGDDREHCPRDLVARPEGRRVPVAPDADPEPLRTHGVVVGVAPHAEDDLGGSGPAGNVKRE